MITIVVPVYEKTEIVQKFLELSEEILKSNILIVIDSGGGSPLKKLATHYEEFPKGDLSAARKRGISLAETDFIFNLDADTIVPISYVSEAVQILESCKDVFAVALDYEKLKGHLGFGTSVWKANILKQLYDWKKGMGVCECVYMWSKIFKAGGRLETLPMRAIHLKKERYENGE